MRITKVGWTLIALACCAAVLTVFEPIAGAVMALVLAVVLLLALAEGMGGGSDSHGGHEVWAKTDAARRAEARHGQKPGPYGN